MTLEELALHLGMDARVVRKWAERGKLPGTMISGQWRFNRAQMLDWLQRELHTLEREQIQHQMLRVVIVIDAFVLHAGGVHPIRNGVPRIVPVGLYIEG